MPLLLAEASGQVDPQRDHVLTGMETHVPCRALPDGNLGGYPMRSIFTHDFHFIRNFQPERWPAGDPAGDEMPSYEQLATNTRVGWADCDASPSKAWMLLHRDEPATAALAKAAFDKRPARELYDLRKDPYEMTNLADDPAYAKTIELLETRLMSELKATGDPRATGHGDELDRANARPAAAARTKPKKKY
jgi:uncharacterized sulfatase